ncbi:hypothetical protein [Streptomyces sp. NBC_01320]|uniref:hypothetical protein n=1 Tax=Streptomyces sp. NBC_01320 TaxID=2903824 RepID=UPI002E13A170|nr:hypothetical protein OG395_57250 [Streptomyces sp. NBC_01320]
MGEYCNSRIPTLHQCHADTIDTTVVGYTGHRKRPRNLALVPEGESTPWLSARLEPALAARVGAALAGAEVVGERRAGGETYTRIQTDLTVEILAGTGRHGRLTVVWMR